MGEELGLEAPQSGGAEGPLARDVGDPGPRPQAGGCPQGNAGPQRMWTLRWKHRGCDVKGRPPGRRGVGPSVPGAAPGPGLGGGGWHLEAGRPQGGRAGRRGAGAHRRSLRPRGDMEAPGPPGWQQRREPRVRGPVGASWGQGILESADASPGSGPDSDLVPPDTNHKTPGNKRPKLY